MVDVSCCVTTNYIIQLSFTVSLVMSCPHCKKTFTKTTSLTRHLREKHEGNTTRIQCDLCQRSFARPEHYRRHVRVVHKQAFKSQTSPYQVIKSKPFNFPMRLQPNSEKNINMDSPTNQAHQIPMELMIFDCESGQHDHNGHMELDLLDSELFALLMHFFNNISSWEVCYIMLQL